MSASVSAASSESQTRTFRSDSLAVGMFVMMAMTIVGRGIGFVRSMAFCRLMSDADVGRWSMAYGFITLITPVMLLGIPGVLPRFTEHYRVRGELSRFVRRIGAGTAFCTVAFVLAMIALPDWFSWFVFLQTEASGLMVAVCAAVIGMIVFNFVCDLSYSLRWVRLVSGLQFAQGVGFTGMSVVWLALGGDFTGVVWTFAITCVTAAAVGAILMRQRWASAHVLPSTDERDASSASHTETTSLWKMIIRMAPYAAAIWMMNLIGNLFELTDRTMILHFLGDPVSGELTSNASAGQSAVGQYHSGRMIPMLLLSLASMIAGVLLPYLAADWEAGRRTQVQARVRDTLMMVSLGFTVGGAFAILLGPIVFETFLQGRYADGLMVMPVAMCFCIWSALVTIGQTYLWTIEKGKWVAVAMLAGLVSNVGLNALLLPRFGLSGAVIASLCSYGVVMIGVWMAMVRCDYPLDHSLVLLSLVPLTLLISPILSVLASLTIAHRYLQDAKARERLLETIPASLAKRLRKFTVAPD